MTRIYKTNYLFFAVYTSMTELLSILFKDFNTQVTDPWKDQYTTLVYLPWILKPLFGFLSDWIYPFYFRTKGYMIIIGVLNVLLSFLAVKFLKDVQSDPSKSLHFFIVMALIYMCLAAVDSVCRNGQ